MILILEPNTSLESAGYRALAAQLDRLPGIQYRVHREVGAEVTLTEIYLIGNTAALTVEQMQVLPGVQKVVRVSEAYRVLGRHQQGDDRPASFDYNGVRFGQDSLNVFAGLCAVDSPESAGAMMKALQQHGQVCTRMGAYKPRTNPYAFQGFGAKCLPYVFELAGKYGIRVIAMEVTHESQVDEIRADERRHPGEIQLVGDQGPGFLRQCARQALDLLGHLRRVGDQSVEGDRGDDRGEDGEEGEEGDTSRKNRYVVVAALLECAAGDLPPAPRGDLGGGFSLVTGRTWGGGGDHSSRVATSAESNPNPGHN